MTIERQEAHATFTPIYVNDGKRHRTILCRTRDVERVMAALAECDTITEFAKVQRHRLHIDDLYVELPWFGA